MELKLEYKVFICDTHVGNFIETGDDIFVFDPVDAFLSAEDLTLIAKKLEELNNG